MEKVFHSLRAKLFDGTKIFIHPDVEELYSRSLEVYAAGPGLIVEDVLPFVEKKYKHEDFMETGNEKHNAAAALAYSLRWVPAYIVKLYYPLLNIVESGYFNFDDNIHLRILDVGSGTGSVMWGVISFFETLRDAMRDHGASLNVNIDFLCVDRNGARNDLMNCNVKEIEERYSGRYTVTVINRNVLASNKVTDVLGRHFHLVTLCHFINEIGSENHKCLYRALNAYGELTVPVDGFMVLIEPADETGKVNMYSARHALTGESGFTITDPCPVDGFKGGRIDCANCWGVNYPGNVYPEIMHDLPGLTLPPDQRKNDVKFLYTVLKKTGPRAITEKPLAYSQRTSEGRVKVTSLHCGEKKQDACTSVQKLGMKPFNSMFLPGDYVDMAVRHDVEQGGSEHNVKLPRSSMINMGKYVTEPVATLSAPLTAEDEQAAREFMELLLSGEIYADA